MIIYPGQSYWKKPSSTYHRAAYLRQKPRQTVLIQFCPHRKVGNPSSYCAIHHQITFETNLVDLGVKITRVFSMAVNRMQSSIDINPTGYRTNVLKHSHRALSEAARQGNCALLELMTSSPWCSAKRRDSAYSDGLKAQRVM